MGHPNPLSEYTLDGELIVEIVGRSVEISLPADRILYRRAEPSDNLYFVRRGEVKIILTADQKEIAFGAGEGSLLGVAAMVLDQPYAMTAKAESGANIRKLSSKAFNEPFSTQPKMQGAVLEILASEVRAARKAMSLLLTDL